MVGCHVLLPSLNTCGEPGVREAPGPLYPAKPLLTRSRAFPGVQKLKPEILICLGRNKCKMALPLCAGGVCWASPGARAVRKSARCSLSPEARLLCSWSGDEAPWPSNPCVLAGTQLTLHLSPATVAPESCAAVEIVPGFLSVIRSCPSMCSAPGAVVGPGAQSRPVQSLPVWTDVQRRRLWVGRAFCLVVPVLRTASSRVEAH